MARHCKHCLGNKQTMEVIDCSKYIGVVSLFLFLLCCTLFKANSQPEGFLSIDCGGEGIRTDNETNITWVTDDHYIHNHLGVKAESYYEDEYRFYLGSLRVFPKPVKKACYELPLTPHVPHLLRVSFLDANSTGSRGFNYSVETQDMLYMEKVVFDYSLRFRSENILMSADSVLYICLIRTSECDDPFISAIALRRLQKGMYERAKPGTMLRLIERDDMGDADNVTRYPKDKFDRRWYPWWPTGTKLVNVSNPVSVNNTKNLPPVDVMQTAVVSNSTNIYFSLGTYDTGNSVAILYFAKLNSTETGLFSVGINNAIEKQKIYLKDFSALELAFEFNGTRGATMILESSTPNQSPIINAVEIYSIVLTQTATSLDDVNAIIEVWKALSLNNWTRDPCFGLPWEGIICSNINDTVRISQIDLSGKELRGPIPPTFGRLTELVSMNLQHNNLTGPLPEWISKLSRLKELILDNNYFNGSLPNLSNLTKLETLYLQNNYLSDELPDWISKLPSLKELNIANNNFKGVIPQELLNQQLRKKLNFTFDGNNHLCRTNKECRDHPSSKVVVALGVAGALVLTAILVSIIMYRMKFRSACTQPSPLDYLLVNVACSSKSRAFTIDEMKMATENFTRKIGQGSFGAVFLGKLQDGKQIAVKVLSLFSKHGIEQFLNEVELLSRINHKKLVSFLGYCNESRDLMLIYEYMSGGSLSDNLYDPEAPKYPQLDWKTRLKIALDAAQGLEYLHVGCTPKIIHRDVKTSNILLDSNLNGKLADFGISRVTGNGETSQINTTIKGTPGYLDPMYYKTHMLTDKSDVYSFGVVLLELICGRKPIDLKFSAEKIFLTEWVASYAGVDKDGANIQEIVDERLGNLYNMKSIIRVTNLAWRCIASEPSDRPAIGEVVAEIKEALTYAEDYYKVPDEVSLTFTSSSSSSL